MKSRQPCLSVVCRCADYVLLNKIDMLGSENLDSLTAIVSSLNRLAEVSEIDSRCLQLRMSSSQLLLLLKIRLCLSLHMHMVDFVSENGTLILLPEMGCLREPPQSTTPVASRAQPDHIYHHLNMI